MKRNSPKREMENQFFETENHWPWKIHNIVYNIHGIHTSSSHNVYIELLKQALLTHKFI